MNHIEVTMRFDSIDDLVEFYQKVRNDDPTAYATPVVHTKFTEAEVDKAIEEADFASLADTTPAEEASVVPVLQTPAPSPAPQPKPQKHSRAEVKQACTKAHVEKHLNIKEILKQFGVDSFSALPDDRLDELYDTVTA